MHYDLVGSAIGLLIAINKACKKTDHPIQVITDN